MVNNSLLGKPKPKLRKWKVLNLYAGIGGNRKLWKNVDVTAIEINPKTAKIYQDFFPNDEVIVADAHDYLLKHFKEFDFIWSSPPCPTHSKARWIASKMGDYPPIYPSIKLWQEVIFLNKFAECKWVVENVKPYYKDLENIMEIIKPQAILQKHYIWSNFNILGKKFPSKMYHFNTISELEKEKGIIIPNDAQNKSLLLKNCVKPEIGKHILDCARKNIQQKLVIK